MQGSLSASAPQGQPDFDALRPPSRSSFAAPAEAALVVAELNFPSEHPKGVPGRNNRCGSRRQGRARSRPDGSAYFWFTVVPITETEDGSDRWAVSRGFTSITPSASTHGPQQLERAVARHGNAEAERVRAEPPSGADEPGSWDLNEK